VPGTEYLNNDRCKLKVHVYRIRTGKRRFRFADRVVPSRTRNAHAGAVRARYVPYIYYVRACGAVERKIAENVTYQNPFRDRPRLYNLCCLRTMGPLRYETPEHTRVCVLQMSYLHHTRACVCVCVCMHYVYF